MVDHYKKVVRDPIYGYIGLTENQLEVISLPVFQRLRRISQLSFVDLVYPSATHNRFTHSLGVMHLARILSNHLRTTGMARELDLNEDHLQALEWAGLLHDIGHLPFSHVCEQPFACYIHNTNDWKDYHVNIIAHEIILNPDFGINKILGDDMAQMVYSLISGGNGEIPNILSEAMTGICSIDRLDYLKRDAHHAGTPEYGMIDTERIITSLTYNPDFPHVAPIFRKRSIYTLESLILSYFNMYRALYYHHAVRAACLLFQDILGDAFGHHGLQNELHDKLFTPQFWNDFDNHYFLTLLRQIDNENFRRSLKRVIFRELPKVVPPERIADPNITTIHTFVGVANFKQKREREERIKNRLSNRGYNVEKILLDSPIVIPYPRTLLAESSIYIWEDNWYNIMPITRFSPYLQNLAQAAEVQLGARVYVLPTELVYNRPFIEELNRVIPEEIG